MALKDRIREAMTAAGLTPADLARATKRTPGAVSQWLDGLTKTVKSDTALSLQNATGFNAVWIATGKGEKRAGNVEPGPDIRGELPLISWVQAGSWNEASDPFQPGEAEKWMPCPIPHSKASYVLRVKGDSMTSQFGRTYPEGCLIFVDPEKRSPMNGDRIIAKIEGEDEVTFKVYKSEDGRQWLQPLNSSHLPIREAFRVLGTVIGKWEDG